VIATLDSFRGPGVFRRDYESGNRHMCRSGCASADALVAMVCLNAATDVRRNDYGTAPEASRGCRSGLGDGNGQSAQALFFV